MARYTPKDDYMKGIMHFAECRKFLHWYERAQKGDTYIYFLGAHLMDTSMSIAIKRLTWNLAIKGELYLTQHRVGPYVFQYFASIPKVVIPKLVPLDYTTIRSTHIVSNLQRRLENGEDEKRSRESREINVASDAGSPILLERHGEDGDGSPRPGGLQNTQDQIIATVEPGDTELPR